MKNVKISIEQAKLEVVNFLEWHDLDTDADSMQKEDADEFNEMVIALAKPISTGRAIISEGDYTLTLKREQGELKTVTVSGMNACDVFAADKAKKNNEMAKMGQMVSSMIKVPFAQVNKFTSNELMLLSKLASLFMAV